MKRLALAIFLLSTTGYAANRPAPRLSVAPLASPAGPHSSGASLTTAPDGTVWLTWLEREADGGMELRCATFASRAGAWTAPRTIARGKDWFGNWADFPALSVGAQGHATAVWSVNNPAPAAESHAHHAAEPAGASSQAPHAHDGPGYYAVASSTTDGGRTWSAPAPLSRECRNVEFVSLATLADGRVLAAWLDGRAKHGGGNATQLYARIVGGAGPDVLVDPSVCDCCSTTLTAFPDGTALLVYRGRAEGEVRDIQLARFDGRAWSEPRPLNNDDWRIAGCPVNGPQIASDGGRVGVAWFTAADNEPRVLASFSPDAGTRFLMPLRIDAGKAVGRVDTQLLRDGAMLVTWAAADGALWLRRVSPDFAPSDAVQLVAAHEIAAKTVARAALARDYTGGKSGAEVIVAFNTSGDDSRVRTVRASVPEGELVEAEKDCDCTPSAGQLQGFPFRGKIVARGERTLRVQHADLPGIFRAGTHDFAVDPAVLAAPGVATGREVLGRIERTAEGWRLFDLRLVAAAER